MDINNHGNGQQQLQKNTPLLPRSRFNQQQPQVANAGQHLSNTWGQPSSQILMNLLNIIFQLLKLLKGGDHQPTPASIPDPKPGPIQPVYGVIQPPTPQPVYGVIQPPKDGPTPKPEPPLPQPVYGAIQPPIEPKPEPPIAQPVYGVILPSKK